MFARLHQSSPPSYSLRVSRAGHLACSLLRRFDFVSGAGRATRCPVTLASGNHVALEQFVGDGPPHTVEKLRPHLWITPQHSVASMRRRSTPCSAAFNASGVANSRYGISSRCTKVSYRIGESLCRFAWAFDRAIANCLLRPSKLGYVFYK